MVLHLPRSGSNTSLELVVFEKRRKLSYQKKNSRTSAFVVANTKADATLTTSHVLTCFIYFSC